MNKIPWGLLASPIGFSYGIWVCPHLGQNRTASLSDRESRDAPDQQGEANNDQNTVVGRSGWAARRIILQRICEGTRRYGSFLRLPRTTIQSSGRRTRTCRRSGSLRLLARAAVRSKWANCPNEPGGSR